MAHYEGEFPFLRKSFLHPLALCSRSALDTQSLLIPTFQSASSFLLAEKVANTLLLLLTAGDGGLRCLLHFLCKKSANNFCVQSRSSADPQPTCWIDYQPADANQGSGVGGVGEMNEAGHQMCRERDLPLFFFFLSRPCINCGRSSRVLGGRPGNDRCFCATCFPHPLTHILPG